MVLPDVNSASQVQVVDSLRRKCLFNTFSQLWTDFGFETRTFTDSSVAVMRKNLQLLAKQDHSQYDCVIVSILTYGKEGKLYGSDGELVPVEELVQLFSGDVIHKSLIGKPRLFFLQVSLFQNKNCSILNFCVNVFFHNHQRQQCLHHTGSWFLSSMFQPLAYTSFRLSWQYSL